MAKQTLWQCDKCCKEAINQAIPDGWSCARIYEGEDYGNSTKFVNRLWCFNCTEQAKAQRVAAKKELIA